MDKLTNIFLDDPVILHLLEKRRLKLALQNKVNIEDLQIIQGPQGEQGLPGRDGIDGLPGRDGIDGMNGKDGRNGKDGINGRNGIDGINGRDGISPVIDEEELLKSMIETLKKKKLLDVSYIKGLEGFSMDGVKYKFRELMHGGGASSGTTINFADNETPSGVIDGINTVFTLAHTPSPAGSLSLYLNGAFQQANGGDYNLAGLTITFLNPPSVPSILIANYRY